MENPQHHEDVSTGLSLSLEQQLQGLQRELQREMQEPPPLQLQQQLQQQDLQQQRLHQERPRRQRERPRRQREQPRRQRERPLQREMQEPLPLQLQQRERPLQPEMQELLPLQQQLEQRRQLLLPLQQQLEQRRQLLLQRLQQLEQHLSDGGEGTGEAEMEEDQLNSGCFGERGRGEKAPGGGSGNEKSTAGVTIAISLEDNLQTKGMGLEDPAKTLIVSQSTLQHDFISQSRPCETTAAVDQEGTPELNSDTLPSDQALAATVDTNDVVVKEIRLLPFFLTGRQENPDFGNDELEPVGMVGEGTGEGAMAEGELNSGSLGKRKREEKTSGGERGNKKTAGVRIEISLESILELEKMKLGDAAMNLGVSRSTLKRACREYDIHRWPPRGKKKLIDQSCPHESSTIVCQEGTPKLKSDILPSDQALEATVDTNSVSVKANT